MKPLAVSSELHPVEFKIKTLHNAETSTMLKIILKDTKSVPVLLVLIKRSLKALRSVAKVAIFLELA